MLRKLWSFLLITTLVSFVPNQVVERDAMGQTLPSLTHVATTALLKAAVGVLGLSIRRDGYYASGDGGAGTYKWSASACVLNNGAGDGGTQIPATAGGCWLLVDLQLNVLAFGAYPNYTNSGTTTTAFNYWWTACMSTITGVVLGNDCYIPAGRYALNSMVWDFTGNPNAGPFVHGASMSSTILDFSGTPGAYLFVQNSTGAWQKARFENFTVTAANVVNGDLAAWQINPLNNASIYSSSVILNRVTVNNTASCSPTVKAISTNNFLNGSVNAAIYPLGCPGGY